MCNTDFEVLCSMILAFICGLVWGFYAGITNKKEKKRKQALENSESGEEQ